MSNITKYSILIITLFITAALCLWPDLHPEKVVFSEYHWQVDVLIHSGYFFLVCTLILFLRFPIKMFYTGMYLFGFSVILELLQYFSFNRCVSFMDIADNLLGIIVAILVYHLFLKIFIQSKEYRIKNKDNFK